MISEEQSSTFAAVLQVVSIAHPSSRLLLSVNIISTVFVHNSKLPSVNAEEQLSRKTRSERPRGTTKIEDGGHDGKTARLRCDGEWWCGGATLLMEDGVGR
ncbi:hypothetical protein PIB30_093129 [Stylosanthes scabra]|uniref:Uncharacterized protein n=1 Tax=Stylosanthes scabra TaxID=79078 RepID=A0ABU6ZTP1_9FABA|nr:hypothetical protein [Stylosanthes scabra]